MTESVIVKISSYKHVSDSHWLSRHSCLNVACTVCLSFLSDVLRFLFLQLDEEQSIQMKGETQDKLLACILDAAACMKGCEDRLKTNDMHSSHTSYIVH